MEYTEELELVKRTILEVGALLLEHYNDPRGIEEKDNGTPVSDADKEASGYISRKLISRFPGYGILDEELPDNGSRFKNKFCWVVDPLDGTKNFLAKGNDFCTLIGLIRNHKPVLGVTYAPKKDELAYAVAGQGAYIEIAGETRQLSIDPSEEIRMLMGMTASEDKVNDAVARLEPESFKRMSTARKTVEVAKGTATLFYVPTTDGTKGMSLWDICAPSVILEEAGGSVTDVFGNLIDYSQKETLLRNGIVASNGIIHDWVLEVLS